MKFNIQTSNTERVEVSVDQAMLRPAQDGGFKHPLAYLDATVSVDEGLPTARQQVYAHLGLDRKDVKLKEAMDGSIALLSGGGTLAGAITNDGQITGRLVTQAFLFDAIENKLRSNDYGIQALFNKKAAVVDSIAATKFDRPVIDMSRPEAGRSRAIAQLSEPASMLVLTASDNSYKIPATAIGIEYSDQAAAAFTLPIITMSITRQAEVEALERIENQITAFLNGDTDIGMVSLASISGMVKNARTDFDTGISGAGILSQKAWVKWLFQNSRRMQVDTIITNLDGALAIENRTGRPTVQTDNATSRRIDTTETVVNPTWPGKVDVIISQDPNWPANTIVGFDSRYAYHVVNSTILAYQAMEEFAIRRSTKLRYDTGSISYRLYNDAWQVLTLV